VAALGAELVELDFVAGAAGVFSALLDDEELLFEELPQPASASSPVSASTAQAAPRRIFACSAFWVLKGLSSSFRAVGG
jgi:hypothetical protein